MRQKSDTSPFVHVQIFDLFRILELSVLSVLMQHNQTAYANYLRVRLELSGMPFVSLSSWHNVVCSSATTSSTWSLILRPPKSSPPGEPFF